MQKRICFFIVASLLFFGASAFAKGKSAADPAAASREREARMACLSGDYAKGVAILSELFLDFKDSAYLFNQGRCYEQNGRLEEAISRFREYLRTAPSDASLAEKHIAECESLQQKKLGIGTAPAAQPVTQPGSGPATQPTTGLPAPVAQPALVVATESPQAAPPSPGSGLRVGGLVIAGVGASALIVGLVLNLQANSLAKAIEPPNTYDRGKESTRKTYETFGWVGYGVGAAGIVTGAILYGIGRKKSSDSDVAFVPTVGPEMTGAMLRGNF
jgi:tetratricopeptide (TPR) repeat protein